MKYYVVKLLTNTAGQDGSKIEALYTDLTKAKVGYHQLCANLNNAADVLFAVVKILDFRGEELPGYTEIIDHRPAPTSEEITDVTEG